MCINVVFGYDFYWFRLIYDISMWSLGMVFTGLG